MRPGNMFSRRSRRMISSAVLVVIAATYGIIAFITDGYPVVDVQLHDGSVWVSNRNLGLVGRFNRPIEQLDAVVSPSPEAQPSVDLLQDGSTVFVYDHGANAVRRLDVANVAIGTEGVSVPPGARVGLGGGTVAVLDPKDGRLWVRSVSTFGSLDIESDPPLAQAGTNADVAVGPDGVVYTASATDRRMLTVAGADRDVPRLSESELDVEGSVATVTAVGGQPVVAGRPDAPGRAGRGVRPCRSRPAPRRPARCCAAQVPRRAEFWWRPIPNCSTSR